MKRLLLILTTFTLNGIISMEWNHVFWKQASHKTPLKDDGQAEKIATKIKNTAIKIDPNYWLNRNIEIYDYVLNKDLVKDGIITQSEENSCTIVWPNLTINMAGWFYNVNFEVLCNWSAANGNAKINASTGESSYQIAQKIQNFPKEIYLKYSYWHTHSLQDNIPKLRKVLVNQKVLTIEEASVVTGVRVLTPNPSPGPTLQGIIVNDCNTASEAIASVDYV